MFTVLTLFFYNACEQRVGFERKPLILKPVDTDESSDSGSDDSDDDAPLCCQCACAKSGQPAGPEEKQQVNGFGTWTAALVGVCLCCSACVCMPVSVCACMCLSTLLCGGVCHILFLGLWVLFRWAVTVSRCPVFINKPSDTLIKHEGRIFKNRSWFLYNFWLYPTQVFGLATVQRKQFANYCNRSQLRVKEDTN